MKARRRAHRWPHVRRWRYGRATGPQERFWSTEGQTWLTLTVTRHRVRLPWRIRLKLWWWEKRMSPPERAHLTAMQLALLYGFKDDDPDRRR